MKTYVSLALLALVLSVSGCAMQIGVQRPAVVVASAPPATVIVPDYYVWDGSEYVAWCSASCQYVYWSTAGWMVCSPDVMFRFGQWNRHYPNWRRESIPYHHGQRPHR